jgi:hypothetical protein
MKKEKRNHMDQYTKKHEIHRGDETSTFYFLGASSCRTDERTREKL